MSNKKSTTSFDEIDQKTGEFKRKPTSYHSVIESGSKEYPVEAGRYHLYVSYACPWASRCLAFLALKGIGRDVIDVHTVRPEWGVVDEESGAKSWVFGKKDDKVGGISIADPLYGLDNMRQLYLKDNSDYTGKYTVPVLWDAKSESIVNNESSEIIRMLNSNFDELAKNAQVDLAPKALLDDIDALNDSFYNSVNNGVYRCGFATTQDAYATAFKELFAKLDELEALLDKSRFLMGDTLLEPDVRLFVTIVRFDAVYQFHFKCNKRPITSYPNLSNWLRDVYQYPGIADTVNMVHIKNHYYGSHPKINPYLIVPIGPDNIDFSQPHDRKTRKYE